MSALYKYQALSSGRRSAIDELIRLDVWGIQEDYHVTDHYKDTLEKAADEIDTLLGGQEIEIPAERLEILE